MTEKPSQDRTARIRDIETRLEAIEGERRTLVQELSALRASGLSESDLPPLLGLPAAARAPSTPGEKVDLFLLLFRARESVFPKLWENSSKGTKGYSPACNNEWVRSVCGKPQVKCSECPNQAFPKLDADAVRDHLQRGITIGTYAIRENDTCTFLAADFDGSGWRQDVVAYRAAARELGIQAEVERSRSGDGAHAWIFFSEPVAARLARQLGTIIVARALAARHVMSLDTYDRFFPNQDFLPKGGFGNLIALPLQRLPREKGNTVFLKDDLSPQEDQWAALAASRRLSGDDLRHVLARQLSGNTFSSLRFEDESVASAERAIDSGNHKVVPGCHPGQIEIENGAQLSVKTADLPAAVFSAFKRTAVFANPKFFELERMRFSTWKTPRFIFCGEVQPDRLILPRGSLDTCLEIARTAGSSVVVKDVRPQSPKLKAEFVGELSAEQKKAVSALSKHEIGVLVAPPGAGKTVMGCALIAKRKTSTLVLVHRTPLMEQWRARLSEFLGVTPKSIGTFGGAKKKQTGQIDVGMLPTFAKLENPEEALAGYGQVIIDECHHVPAVSFEAVLKKCPSRYVLGLTATPYRKDGHQAIIHMQCGPVRYEMAEVDGPRLDKRVIVRETQFRMPDDSGPQPPIHLVWENLVSDPGRLALVASDLKATLQGGRFPLVISERKEHLAQLGRVFDELLGMPEAKGHTLVGGMGKKARAAILQEIEVSRSNGGKPYVLATGSFIGEGFDFPALDTLIIAMPVSFKGKLIQYAGRLHRASPGKIDALIYDYLDGSSALTVSMFRKRLTAYNKMGYQVETQTGSRAGRMNKMQTDFFARR
jgi:superfamily II DNA or RNA helicase